MIRLAPHLRAPLAALAMAALAATTLPAHSQASAKKDLVAKIVELQKPGIESLGQMVANQATGQILQVAGRAIDRMSPERREAAAQAVKVEIQKFHADITPLLRDRAIKLAPSTIGAKLEETFSEEELKSLVTWLESPVYKRFQGIATEMQQGLVNKIVADTRPAVEPKLKALEKTLSDKLKAVAEAPAPTASGAKPAPAKK